MATMARWTAALRVSQRELGLVAQAGPHDRGCHAQIATQDRPGSASGEATPIQGRSSPARPYRSRPVRRAATPSRAVSRGGGSE